MRYALLLATLILAALVGCRSEEGRYKRASLSLETNAVNVYIRGRYHGDSRHPCAPALSGSPRVNGVAMEVIDSGGGEHIPDSDDLDCLGLSYQLDLKLLPADTESLEITFESLQRGGQVFADARDWHLSADWLHTRVWIEGDLATSMRAHEEFAVRWEPADDPVPELYPLAFFAGRWRSAVGTTIELVDSEPGRARFRFAGSEPDTLWNVTATREGRLENTSCSGFEDCEFYAGGDTALLHPVGIPPARPDSVAPPRECIAAPGADGGSYRAPRWQPLPDLSALRIGSNMSCDGADLYFVLLGACGVCGGGKSTYVVGNRGTQAASFSVRSNAETIEGGALEPEQLSAPFEIAFDGTLSQIEILNDGDCDATSNAEWVASVACEVIGNPTAPLRDDCNSTCKLAEELPQHER